MSLVTFNLKRKLFTFFIVSCCFPLIIFDECVQATPQCSYGFLDAWISTDGVSWMNTTVTNMSLECGQIFFIKAVMKSSQHNIWMALYLSEPGTDDYANQSFIVLKGPCDINEGYDVGQVEINETKVVTWKLQVKDTPSWVGGYTPLSITGFFQKQQQDSWITEDISFSIARIHLNDSMWKESMQVSFHSEPSETNEDTYYHVLILLCILIVCVCMLGLITWIYNQ
jgi:hypothetical protein